MIKSVLVALAATVFAYGQETLSEPASDFAFSFYQHLQPEDNAVFSPFSIYACLAMPYMGAEGNTRQELQNVLGLPPDSIGRLLSSYLAKANSPPQNEKGYQLQIASSLWTAYDIAILPRFRQTIETDFQAAVRNVNFANSQIATSAINSWISEHTQGKIPNLLSPSDVSASTKLVLANAIYFKGAWLKPFKPEQTQLSAFWTDDETCFDTPMMEQTAFFSYFETPAFQIVSLPFIGRTDVDAEMAFVAFLPKKGEKLPELTSDSFAQHLSFLGPRKVHVTLPKFTLDEKIGLNSTLIAMGLKDAFTPFAADLSGINGSRDLYFSKALHQAFFSLDEAGVTAAAATAISINVTSANPQPVPIIEFNADHPFLFFIVDLRTKIPLFMGKLTLPPCS